MTDLELAAWAAGIIEGEGCILKTASHSAKVVVSMTDKDILDRLQKIFGGSVSSLVKRKQHWKDAWIWIVSGTEAENCMKLILPYMGIRRSVKINEALDRIQSRRDTLSRDYERRLEAGRRYLDTDLTLMQVASEYGISYESVRKYANIEKQRRQ